MVFPSLLKWESKGAGMRSEAEVSKHLLSWAGADPPVSQECDVMTYVRETCGCCGESWPPRGGGARLLVSLGGPRPGVRVICLGRALPLRVTVSPCAPGRAPWACLPGPGVSAHSHPPLPLTLPPTPRLREAVWGPGRGVRHRQLREHRLHQLHPGKELCHQRGQQAGGHCQGPQVRDRSAAPAVGAGGESGGPTHGQGGQAGRKP